MGDHFHHFRALAELIKQNIKSVHCTTRAREGGGRSGISSFVRSFLLSCCHCQSSTLEVLVVAAAGNADGRGRGGVHGRADGGGPYQEETSTLVGR